MLLTFKNLFTNSKGRKEITIYIQYIKKAPLKQVQLKISVTDIFAELGLFCAAVKHTILSRIKFVIIFYIIVCVLSVTTKILSLFLSVCYKVSLRTIDCMIRSD